jgi:hypothetical protein
MSRHREVFPTEDIPHKWAHAAQDSARNPQGNLHFSGDTITSYRTAIAKIYRHKARGTLVLIDECGHSNTTRKQIHMIQGAVRHLPAMRVPYPVIGKYGAGMHTADGAHALNVKFLADGAASALKKAQRVLRVYAIGYKRNAARECVDNAARYMAFFGMRGKRPAFPELEWNAAAARAQRIENPDPASLDARERASARRAAATADKREYLAEMRRSMCAAKVAAEFYPRMAARTAWRLANPWDSNAYFRTDYGDAVMLRVSHEDSDGEVIETSQGARIPLAAAPMVWNLVERARAAGGYSRGLNAVKIGDYALDKIDADGALHVGCHVIPHSELRSMARQLHLA